MPLDKGELHMVITRILEFKEIWCGAEVDLFKLRVKLVDSICEKFASSTVRIPTVNEIERKISFSDLWISHPQRPQAHKRHLAQAIHNLCLEVNK